MNENVMYSILAIEIMSLLKAWIHHAIYNLESWGFNAVKSQIYGIWAQNPMCLASDYDYDRLCVS